MSCGRCLEITCLVISIIVFIFTFPLSLTACFKIADQYEKIVILRIGKMRGRPRGPGMVFYLPCIDKVYRMDMRLLSMDVPKQSVITKDAVSVSVDAVIYYLIFNPTMVLLKVVDYRQSTHLLAMTMLRFLMGTKTLAEILANREFLQVTMQTKLDKVTDPWGVKIERVEIKDVSLPESMQRAMAAEAEAVQEARAKVIDSEGELRSAKTLSQAADLYAKAPGSLQLKYLQTLNTISTENNHMIIFPLPMDIMGRMARK